MHNYIIPSLQLIPFQANLVNLLEEFLLFQSVLILRLALLGCE